MLTGKYVKCNRVFERIFSDYGWKEELDPSDAAEWIGDCIDKIGVPMQYVEKVTGQDASNPTIKISNYTGVLPCDLHKVVTVREYNTMVTMRYTGDMFHLAYKDDRATSLAADSDTTYKLNNNYIFTSFEEGEVEMTYLAFPVDENGYPMIPDDTYIIEACVKYIAYMIARKKWIRGEIAKDILHDLEQDMLFAIPAAKTKAIMPSIDKMESWKNSLLRASRKINEHSGGFAYNGQQEQRYIKP